MIAKLESLASVVSEEALDEVVQLLEVRAAREETAETTEETLVPLSEIPGDGLGWLWGNRVPLGSLTAIFGARGAGKSFVALDMAARVSSGTPWPDDPLTPQTPGSVLLVAMEDPLGAVVKRLRAAGADLGKINGIPAADPETYEHRTFRAKDIDKWDKIAAGIPDLRLVIVDSFALFLGVGYDRRTGELAKLLARLAEFASRHKVAVVLMNATDKVSAGQTWRYGENVIPAIESRARAVWTVEDEPLVTEHRFFLPGRINLTPGPDGLEFTINRETGRIDWGEEPVPICADRGRPTARESSAVAQAARWLKDFLGPGPRPAELVFDRGDGLGHTRRALYAAKEKLGIVSEKATGAFKVAWTWKLRPAFAAAPGRNGHAGETGSTTPDPTDVGRAEDSKITPRAPGTDAGRAVPERFKVRRASEIVEPLAPAKGSGPVRREDSKITAAHDLFEATPAASIFGSILGDGANVPLCVGARLAGTVSVGREGNRRARRRKR